MNNSVFGKTMENVQKYKRFTILDISKIIIHDFHYNYMKKNFGDNVKLLFTDTDSFIYHIFLSNFYILNILYIFCKMDLVPLKEVHFYKKVKFQSFQKTFSN